MKDLRLFEDSEKEKSRFRQTYEIYNQKRVSTFQKIREYSFSHLLIQMNFFKRYHCINRQRRSQFRRTI